MGGSQTHTRAMGISVPGSRKSHFSFWHLKCSDVSASGLATLLPSPRTLMPAHRVLQSFLCLRFGAFKKAKQGWMVFCTPSPSCPHQARTCHYQGPDQHTPSPGQGSRGAAQCLQPGGACPARVGHRRSAPRGTRLLLCSAALLLPGHKATPSSPWEQGHSWAAWIQCRFV